jgi:glycine/D-amino acid oxidase-like deaminating enzyme
VTRSLWLTEALGDVPRRQQLAGDVRCDVCIVGGGFTGLWTALQIRELEPSADIVVLEADVCGGGASGRNGGFAMTMWSKFGSLKKLGPTAEAVWLAQQAAESVSAIGRFCDENGIDAAYRRNGWVWAATSEAQLGAWDATMEALAAAGIGEALEPLTPAEVARRSGSPEHLAGVFDPDVAHLQPAMLARGLARVAEARGIRIHEGTEMTELGRTSPPTVTTARGTVHAGAVVLAVNAWAARLPEVRRSLVVTSSDVIATPPVPAVLDEIGWTWRDGPCVSDSRRLVNYYRPTRDGRVVFGKGGGLLALAGRIGPKFDAPSSRADVVLHHLHRNYPRLAETPADGSWCGPIDYALDGLPFLHRLPGAPDVIVAAGFSGNGVGPAHTAGRALASMALRRDDDWSRTLLARAPAGRLPPEPGTWLGGQVVKRALRRKEDAEDRGARTDPVTLRLAALDPTSFVDRG